MGADDRDDPLVEVGRFERPHGIHGEIAFFGGHEGTTAEALPYRKLRVGGRDLRIEGSRPKGNRLLLKLEVIATPEGARMLTGLQAYVHECELPELPEGALYLRDLVGMTLFDARSGRRAGSVREVQRLAGRDYLEIERGTLIPFVDELIVAVDRDARTITMRIPVGLLELDGGSGD